MRSLTIRIKGHDLPGLACGGRVGVHVGIQRGREVVDVVPGDASEAVFEVRLDVATTPLGDVDFKGAWVHGQRGERFLYLSWGEAESSGLFSMFRRAKIHLNTIERQQLDQACKTGTILEGWLPLTDGRGGPICASVRPPTLQWRVVEDDSARSSTDPGQRPA